MIMKSRRLALCMLGLSLLGTPVFGQQSKEKVKTYQGKVIRLVPLTDEAHGGAHLELDTPAGPVEVHLGPKWVESFQQKGYGAGHEIMVIGATFRFGSKDEFEVSDIKPVKKKKR